MAEMQRKDGDKSQMFAALKYSKQVCRRGLDFLRFVPIVLPHSEMCHRSSFFQYYTSQQKCKCGKEGEGLIPHRTSRPSPEITGAKPAER